MLTFKKFKLNISLTISDDVSTFNPNTDYNELFIRPIFYINYDNIWYKIINLREIKYSFPRKIQLNSSKECIDALNAIKDYLFNNTYNKEQLVEKILKLI